MRVLKILITIVMIFMMTGCSMLMMSNDRQDRSDTNEQKAADVEGCAEEKLNQEQDEMQKGKDMDDSGDIIDGIIENEKPVLSEDDEKEQVLLPDSEPKGEKLDFEILDSLDNTKYSWWYNPNDSHRTPGIPDHAKELIDKYDGIFTGDTSDKTVYLTFDEGYENGYTPQILDTLRDNEVKAAFFVTGSYVNNNPELIKRMLDEGHEVGSHTITHPSLSEVDNVKLERELLGFEKEFYAEYRRGFKYLRPPKGEYSERTLEAARQLGYKSVFWSFAYRDWEVDNQNGADYAYNKVMDNLHNGAVILLHAVSSDNAQALDSMIKAIRLQGYEIRPFDL